MSGMENMTEEQAIALFNTNWWEGATDRQIAEFQINTPRLCCPFSRFHEAMEKTLGRPIWTHEFGREGAEAMKKELLGEKAPPTLEEIISLILRDKKKAVLIAFM